MTNKEFVDKLYDSRLVSMALTRMKQKNIDLDKLGDNILPDVMETMLEIVRQAEKTSVKFNRQEDNQIYKNFEMMISAGHKRKE